MEIEGFEKILNIAHKLGLRVLPDNPREFVEKTMVLPCLDDITGMRVDFIFSSSIYEREALKRVKLIKIDDVYVRYASPEDVIIHKIISGREKDFEDIKSILAKTKEIDENYIKKWLLEFEKILDEKLIERFDRVKATRLR